MNSILYETFRNTSSLGISYAWYTNTGGHHPLHWHDEIELLYPLSGEADIILDGEAYRLLKRHLLVVESCQVHSTHSYNSSSMFLCIHLSRDRLREYISDIDTLRLRCDPGVISDSNFPDYLDICRLLDELTRLYVKEDSAFALEADGIILQVAARLYEFFSFRTTALPVTDGMSAERIHRIISFVEEHFREPVSLSDAAGELNLGKEYFCRFFKKNMGISFLQYVNEVRAAHTYYDLLHTDLSVSEIMEKNGFTNQKLFNRCFREIYGCTPTAVRKNVRENARENTGNERKNTFRFPPSVLY